ncbi:hypothetical protein NC651_034384 [Populus alba x Populus x berolinensis]|nr:hypothetical protein NC651_034384 [Populus alba x Populus x berolinensis]
MVRFEIQHKYTTDRLSINGLRPGRLDFHVRGGSGCEESLASTATGGEHSFLSKWQAPLLCTQLFINSMAIKSPGWIKISWQKIAAAPAKIAGSYTASTRGKMGRISGGSTLSGCM